MYSKRKSLRSLACIALLMLLTACAQANDLYVATTGSDTNPGTQALPFKTIQMGINTASAGDTLYVAAGTYSESLSWVAKDLTLQGAGASQTILDGTFAGQYSAARGLYTQGLSAASRIEGFTVSNFNFWGSEGTAPGGGMYNDNSSLTVANCAFLQNTVNGIPGSGGGGGMYNLGGSPTVTGCTFASNVTNGGIGGSGMLNDNSNPTITNCAFTMNYATSYGGGMYNNNCNPTITNCTFKTNYAHFGAGMYNLGGNPTLTDCTFDSNAYSDPSRRGLPDFGGGLFNDLSDAIVTHCDFLNNAAELGGGMSSSGNNPIVTRCRFIGNAVSSGGGGLEVTGGSPILTNCLFQSNQGPTGAGIEAVGGTAINCYFVWNASTNIGGGLSYSGDGTTLFTLINCTFLANSTTGEGGAIETSSTLTGVTLTNCILWGDSGAVEGNEIEGIVIADHSIIENYPGLTSMPDANGNFSADPLFTGGAHLSWGSPAIDAGTDAAVTVPPFPLDPTGAFIIDLDGNPRISRARVDIGAYEYQNRAPVANAGPAQMVQATHSGNPANDTAAVTLDGSASSDPEGDALTYAWNDGQGDTATGVQPTLNLKVGSYTFTLTVTDLYGASSAATVTITVSPAANQPPVANAGADQTVTASAATNTASATLDGSGSYDPDGDSLTYAWDDGQGHTSSAVQPTFTLPVGSHTFTLTVTDTYGASTSSTTHVTVNNPVPVIRGLRPARANAADPAFTLTVNGSNFVNGSTVNWNGSPLTTTFVSATRLTASVPAANIASPGKAIITVVSPGPGGGPSNAKSFTIVVTTLKLSINSITRDSTTGAYTVNFSLSNIGYLPAENTNITKSALNRVATTSALPVSLGTIAAGSSASDSLTYPSSVGSPGSLVGLRVTAKFTDGSATVSAKVTLP